MGADGESIDGREGAMHREGKWIVLLSLLTVAALGCSPCRAEDGSASVPSTAVATTIPSPGRAEASPTTTRSYEPVPASMSDADLRRLIYQETVVDMSGLEARVRNALSSYLDNPSTCRVRFFRGSLGDRAAGRFDRIDVDLEGTVVKSLEVARARLVLHRPLLQLDMLYREGRLRFHDQGKVDFFLHVEEEALNRMLRVKATKLKLRGPTMDLCDGYVRFRGRMKVLFFNNNIRVRGRLTVHEGRKIYFTPHSMQLDFLPIPGFVLRAIAKKINPIADLSGFKLTLDCSVIRIVNDNLYLASESARAMVEEAILP